MLLKTGYRETADIGGPGRQADQTETQTDQTETQTDQTETQTDLTETQTDHIGAQVGQRQIHRLA